MRHWPEHNYPAFCNAADKLRELGLIVFNPAESSPDLTFEEYMAIDLPEVHMCDIVFVLPDWECSRGAILEVMTARALGKKVLDISPYIFGQEYPTALCPAEIASKACAESMRDGLGHGSGVWKIEPTISTSCTATSSVLVSVRLSIPPEVFT